MHLYNTTTTTTPSPSSEVATDRKILTPTIMISVTILLLVGTWFIFALPVHLSKQGLISATPPFGLGERILWAPWNLRNHALCSLRSTAKGAFRTIGRLRRRLRNGKRTSDRNRAYLLPAYHVSNVPASFSLRSSRSRGQFRIITAALPQRNYFRFLDLAFEVRKFVYLHVVSAYRVVDCQPNAVLQPYSIYKLQTALLRTCRQTRIEFHPIFFQNTLFRMRADYPFYIHMRLPTIIHLTELHINMKWGRHGADGMSAMFSDLKKMINLRELSITCHDLRAYHESFGNLLRCIYFGNTSSAISRGQLQYVSFTAELAASVSDALSGHFRTIERRATREWGDNVVVHSTKEVGHEPRTNRRRIVRRLLVLQRPGYRRGYLRRGIAAMQNKIAY